MKFTRNTNTNRSRLAAYNLLGTLGQKFIAAIVGLIIPKLIIESYGSTINGIVSAATSFLGIISLIQGGFDSVAKTAFYRPLSQNDMETVSRVYNTADSFFKRIAIAFGTYCICLSLIFPLFNDSGCPYPFVVSLVLILGIDTFASEYFGITYIVLFNADQRSSITSIISILCTVLNAILVYCFVKAGAPIHVVKLVSATVFLLRPIFVNIIGKQMYGIDRSIEEDKSLLSERWDNFGVTVAGFVHSKVDYIMMTFFMNIKEVSVYGVYNLVASTLQGFISALSTAFVPGLGNMFANGEKKSFERTFSLYEFVNTFFTAWLYGVAGIMIIPFVTVYTAKVTDVNYIRPLFGYFLIMSQAIYCLRLPYQYAIVNARHFVQMKKPAYIEVILNIVISALLMIPYGITGLAVGTLVSALYRTEYFAWYCSKNITGFTMKTHIKRLLVFLGAIIVSIVLSSFIPIGVSNFINWFYKAIVISALVFIVELVFGLLFYKSDCKTFISNIKGIIKR